MTVSMVIRLDGASGVRKEGWVWIEASPAVSIAECAEFIRSVDAPAHSPCCNRCVVTPT
ncbi:hypothetical protein L227DRAFT_126333 [Lentinus tigrinus ALCF2SS1-6]|uniref:Uncharacterized protein n=1 Tax=Lentinus tigrinus ALCF2SS1-6 TaxID=1328759 RepID=A0A5C2SQ05_9APHY|nr:hypothetical protein L227DRAFT_126333 [Lentinus tigrinus ALCF2SS1-6]